MSGKTVLARAQARRDVADIIDYYAREAGTDVARRFIDALQASYRAIGERPGIGSPRYAHELGLPGLRSRKLARFPYLVFYVERADHIEIWRVLHGQRDIPSWMGDE